MTVPVGRAAYGLIMRMLRLSAAFERDLMLAGDAMLQRRREHALHGRCDRDDPEQQESSNFVHAVGPGS